MKFGQVLFPTVLKRFIVFGYILETLLLLIIGLSTFVLSFFDNFYNNILRSIWGHSFLGAGFGISLAVAIILGYATQTERTWRIISRFLAKIPVRPVRRFAATIEQWKLLWDFAQTHGAILASFYNKEMRWPAVITGYFSYLSGDKHTYDYKCAFP
jgi:hypothetical protein